MPTIAKAATKAFDSFAKKTTKRTTYKDLTTDKIKKIDDTLDVDAVDTAVEQIVDTPQTKEFIDTRETDLKSEKSDIFLKTQKTEADIADYEGAGVTVENNFDGRLKVLQEQRKELYIKANNKKKSLEATELLNQSISEGNSGYNSLYDTLSSSVGKGKATHNIEATKKSIYNRVSSGMTELKDTMRTKWAGLSQDLEFHAEVIRYLKDGQIKNQKILSDVKQVAEQWKTAANKIKSLRANTGARIGNLEDWIIPQTHDALKLKRAKFKKWKNSIITKLDVKRIETEQGADIDSVLRSAYKNITEPKIERVSGGTSSVVKRGTDSRVLHFKTGDDIINYNKEYGNPDVFATMDNHIKGQSEEIALMKMFGGNPDQTFNELKEIARADGMGDFEEKKLDALWNVVSGKMNGDSIINTLDARIANASGGMRALMISAKLGSAAISALGDLGNIFLGAGYRDLSSIKMFGRGLQGLFQEAVGGTKTGANLKLANRIGVVSEFANASLANSRFADTVGGGFMQKTAETVIRSSGLGSYTETMQAAFGIELAANIAENFSKKLDDVPFAKMMKEYGIDDAKWDIVRKSGAVHDVKGSEFFDVTKLYDIDEDIAYKMSDMMTNEMNAFVIMPGARTQVYTTWGKKKGTAAGELARNIGMFKSFPISVVMMHLNRMSTMEGLGKTAYTGKVIGSGLVMGSITLWAYDIASGKTPRSIRPAMIGEALSKSGGLGIFGDFFIGLTETKYGHNFSDMLLGAAPAVLNDIVKSAQDLIVKDDKSKAVGNIYKRAASYIPGQNLWYTRAAIERTIGDWVGDVVDPDHQKKKRNRAKRMRLRDQEEIKINF